MPPRKSDPAPPPQQQRKKTNAHADTHDNDNDNDNDTSITPTAADESQISTTATATAADRKDKGKDYKDKDADVTTIEDLMLPKSIITRLSKGVLPPSTQIQANAILAMSKSATIFINYLASHANEHTITANKKTIAPADVFKALDDIEFSFLKEPLEAEFAKFNQVKTEKRTNYRQKSRTKPSPDGDGDDTEMAGTTIVDTTMSSERGGAPRAKKARVDAAGKGTGTGTADDDDAETEEDGEGGGDVQDDEEEDDDEQGQEEEEEDDDENAQAGSGDDTQDALEERVVTEDGDEALDGDDSD
ncbi:hypothetical protein QQS21_003965 [Conoideocrella luteorostrata]|uniref:DNA polymerase epsilon subunit D n=1 Tax=Conoideocrella luteorostrata TaxID=1105319 RepID=A0AAJ0CUS6_9HYPO|nr:hypothetical protein QQS21_003965 [Conoideocrella luteorostrata]